MKQKLHIRGGYKELWAYRLEPEHMRVLATLYWLALLAAASLVMLGSLTYGFWMLITTLTMDDTAFSTPSLSATPFTRVELQEALRQFDERARRFESLKVDTQEFSNPYSAPAQ